MSFGRGAVIKSSVEVERKANEGIALMPSGLGREGDVFLWGPWGPGRQRVEEGLGWVV